MDKDGKQHRELGDVLMAYCIRIQGYLAPKSTFIPTTSVLAAAWKLTAWNEMLAICFHVTYSATQLPHPGPGSHQFSYLTRVCIQLGLSIPGHPSQKGLAVLRQQLWSPCYSRGQLRSGQIRVSMVPCVRYVCYSLVWRKYTAWSDPEALWEGSLQEPGQVGVKTRAFGTINLLLCDFTLCWVNLAFQAVSNLVFHTPNELWECHSG